MEELKKAPVTVLLILANILVFTAVEFTGGSEDTMHMLQCGAAYTPAIMQGEYYRIFTSMFLHFGPQHLGNNMLVLFVLGGRLERTVGKLKYLLIYLLGGMGGNLLCLFLELDSADFAVSAGASGAVFAVMGAMIYAVIRGRGHIEDLSAISSTWYSGRCDPGHRTCDRRNSSPDLYSRYSCRGTEELDGFRTYSGTSYVCAVR